MHFDQSHRPQCLPEKINIDKSGANAAAIGRYNAEYGTTITIVEQDHRGKKRVTRPMMGFKSFDVAQATLTGIELIRMIKKGQMEDDDEEGLSADEQFNQWAA